MTDVPDIYQPSGPHVAEVGFDWNPVHALQHVAEVALPAIKHFAAAAAEVALNPAHLLGPVLRKTGLGYVADILDAPERLAQSGASMASHMAGAILRGDPAGLARAVKAGTKEITGNPMFLAAQTGASFIPGIGTSVSSGMAAAAALGSGESLQDAAIAAARAALPGGPLVQAAMDIGVGLAKGQSLTEAGLGAVRDQLPGGEAGKAAFDTALALAHGQSLSAAAIGAARGQLPPEARGAFDAGLSVAHGKPLSEAGILALRSTLPGGPAARAALDAGLALQRRRTMPPEAIARNRAALGPKGRKVFDAAWKAGMHAPARATNKPRHATTRALPTPWPVRRSLAKGVHESFATPDTVKSEIARTNAFVHSLTDEILSAYKAEPLPVSAEKAAFFTQYQDWHRSYTVFVGQNGGDTWTPLQYLSYLSIQEQNTQYDREARDHQLRFKNLGFKSNTPPPDIIPPGHGGFLGGMGAGVILLLLIMFGLKGKKLCPVLLQSSDELCPSREAPLPFRLC